MLDAGLSAGTTDKNLSVLSQALNKAVSWELIAHNPVKAYLVPRPKGAAAGRAHCPKKQRRSSWPRLREPAKRPFTTWLSS